MRHLYILNESHTLVTLLCGIDAYSFAEIRRFSLKRFTKNGLKKQQLLWRVWQQLPSVSKQIYSLYEIVDRFTLWKSLIREIKLYLVFCKYNAHKKVNIDLLPYTYSC